MKLLLDARKLHDGGIGTYLRNLIIGLGNHPEISLTVLVRSTEAGDPLVSSFPQIETTAGLYSLRELLSLSREISWDSFSLFHTPHFVLPLAIPIPSVVTIHDLNHLFHPERFYYPFIAAPYIFSAVSRARQIIAVSEQTRAEIVSFSGWWPGVTNKLSVIPNSVPLSGNFGGLAKLSTTIEEENSTQTPYLLAVISTDKPHKGVPDLLAAFEKVASNFSPLELMIVGAGTPRPEKVPSSIGSRVQLIGRVDSAEMDRLYRGARAVVVASLQEGFCLPVIEAHAAGVSVIARPVSTISRLMTEEDSLAADMSVDALIGAMTAQLNRPPADRKRLVQHAAQFSIPKITAQTVDCYWRALQ
jgi:glycosyltransferase involved in cell wall biosynthesis